MAGHRRAGSSLVTARLPSQPTAIKIRSPQCKARGHRCDRLAIMFSPCEVCAARGGLAVL